ncbi:MAG: DUF429 domain-containing protein [Planctomycetaceae bacterium]|nr:DUF429 domain-containing protein [Planctomycetaceae bacterium]
MESTNTQRKSVYVGIDVAFAKKKRLPICVCEIDQQVVKPLPLRKGFTPPPAGFGNRAALNPTIRLQFADAVAKWLLQLQAELNLTILRVAIDAPSTFCSPDLTRRLSERALDAAGISCFATPTERRFEEKIRTSQAHLDGNGLESTLPNANQLWMLVGFELFKALREHGFECIETYPQAVVRMLKCVGGHKSSGDGYASQLSALGSATGHGAPKELIQALDSAGYGSRHDKLDAFLSAWVATLLPSERHVYGTLPDDAIVVPALDTTTITHGASA